MSKEFSFGDYWFISYHILGTSGSIFNTVTKQRPFDWLLSEGRARTHAIVFFCKIKKSRYDQLSEVLDN